MKFSLLAPAALLVASFSTQAVEFSGSASFTNDYRFRGISQTAGDAAVQASLDADFGNGFFAGIWGSNVDFGDDANLEIDYYAGYAGDLNDDLSYSLTAYYYQYPGYDAADSDYAEFEFQLGWKDLALTWATASDYVNSGEDGQYLALDYSYGLTEQVNLDLHAGYSFGDYWEDLDVGDYQDYSIGLSGSAAGLDLSVAYLVNDIDSGNDADSGPFRNDNTLLFSVSRSF